MNSSMRLNSSEMLILSVCSYPMTTKQLVNKLLDMQVFRSFGYGRNLVRSLKNKRLLISDQGILFLTNQGVEIVNRYVSKTIY